MNIQGKNWYISVMKKHPYFVSRVTKVFSSTSGNVFEAKNGFLTKNYI